MPHVIELFLDEHAEALVRSLWHRLAEAGLPSPATGHGRPHVTLCGAPSLSGEDIEDARNIIDGALPTLTLSTVGCFPGARSALFLGVTPSPELLDLNARLHRELVELPGRVWRHSGAGQWVPHCTLALGMTAAERARAVELCADFAPVTTTASSIEVIDTASNSTLAALAFPVSYS